MNIICVADFTPWCILILSILSILTTTLVQASPASHLDYHNTLLLWQVIKKLGKFPDKWNE